MTYADAFDKIKKKLAKIDTSKMSGDYAIQVTISDEDAAGTFYVSFIDGTFAVEPYDYRDNSVAIDISVDDFIKLVTGKLTADKAISDGKLSLFGDAEAINNIVGIVKAPAKKAPAKKAAEPKKEAPAKKAAEPKKEAPKKAAEPKKEAPAKKPAEPKKEAPQKAAEPKKAPAKTEAKEAPSTKPAAKKTTAKTSK